MKSETEDLIEKLKQGLPYGIVMKTLLIFKRNLSNAINDITKLKSLLFDNFTTDTKNNLYVLDEYVKMLNQVTNNKTIEDLFNKSSYPGSNSDIVLLKMEDLLYYANIYTHLTVLFPIIACVIDLETGKSRPWNIKKKKTVRRIVLLTLIVASTVISTIYHVEKTKLTTALDEFFSSLLLLSSLLVYVDHIDVMWMIPLSLILLAMVID